MVVSFDSVGDHLANADYRTLRETLAWRKSLTAALTSVVPTVLRASNVAFLWAILANSSALYGIPFGTDKGPSYLILLERNTLVIFHGLS